MPGQQVLTGCAVVGRARSENGEEPNIMLLTLMNK